MRLSGAEPEWWIQTAARRSHKVHLICCDAWPIRYHYWTDDCINMITRMTMHYFKCNRMENDNILLSHTRNPANWHAHNKKKCSIKTSVKWSMMNDWTRTIYTYSRQFFAHLLIEFHFYAFYSSVSLKQAVVWGAKREKHNHGALWLFTDLHNSLWISIDDFRNWIMGLHNCFYGDRIVELHIIRFMKINNPQFDSWSSTICCYGAPNNLRRSIIHMMKLHNIHIMELHDWNVNGVS